MSKQNRRRVIFFLNGVGQGDRGMESSGETALETGLL